MKPCKQCPFSKTCEPGALGGSSPLKYIGQAHGPFNLPCHHHCDFDDPQWREKSFDVKQCVGAAIFRNHIGVADKLPKPLLRAPASDLVFKTSAEFIAHHERVPLEWAELFLTVHPPVALLAFELSNTRNLWRIHAHR